MNDSYNVSEIKAQLLLNLRSYLSYLLPRGIFRGDKFYVGNVQGDKGKSLVVELSGGEAGLWHDFATKEGGDIIDLWAAVHGKNARTDFPEVMASIAEWLGYDKKRPEEQYINQKLDEIATYSWNYYDENGQVIVKVFRKDPTGERKEYKPFDVKRGIYGAPEGLRPLYNIPGILKSDEIVLVEGEKCAEALIEQGITATTTMFGSNADANKTDWSQLKGKHIIIWPDNDEAGKKYAENAEKKLLEIGVASLAILEIPQDKPKGWDVADGIVEGFKFQEFLQTGICYIPSKLIPNKLTPNLISMSKTDDMPPKREWIVQDWLPSGYVSALYGDGGVGKSLLVQQLITALAAGKPWLGINLNPIKVYALFCEDDRLELTRRQHAINHFYRVKGYSLEEKIRMMTRVGEDNRLMDFNSKDSGKLTSFFHDLLEDIKAFQPKLVVLDTAADLFDGNENNRTQVRNFIQNCCARIAREIDGAVLLCMHPSDVGIQRKTGTGGSTAWNNTVRSRWYLTRPEKAGVSPDDRILSRKKSNYSQSNDEKIVMRWENGAFAHDDLALGSEPMVRGQYSEKLDLERERKHEVILNLIRRMAYQGKIYTAAQFARSFEGEEGLGSDRNIRGRIDHLATLGQIKFFRNAEEYGIANTNSKYGFLCVKDMETKICIESKVEYKLVKPTHHYLEANGKVLPIKGTNNLW